MNTKKFFKRVSALLLALVLVFTGTITNGVSFAKAEEDTRGLRCQEGTVTIYLNATDSTLNVTDRVVRSADAFYAVYDSMDAAKADDVGAFFGHTDGAHAMIKDASGNYSVSVNKELTVGQVVRYNINILYNDLEGKDMGACPQTFDYYTVAGTTPQTPEPKPEVPDPEVPDPVDTNNLLKDATFATVGQEGSAWETYIGDWSGVQASFSQNGSGTLDLDITNSGNSEWGLQLSQSNIAFKEGKKHKVSFDVTGTQDAAFNVYLQDKWGAGDGDVNTLVNETVTLEANKSQSFSMISDSVGALTNMKLVFGLGQAAGKISISNIKVEATTESEPETPVVVLGENVLRDPEFATLGVNEENWIKHIGSDWAGVNATITQAAGSAIVDISNSGWDTWGLQLHQDNIAVNKGSKYVLNVDVSTTGNKEFKIFLQSEGDVIAETVSMTAGESRTLTLTSKAVGGNAANLFFAMGKGATAGEAAKLTFSNISLKEIKDGNQGSTGGMENPADYTGDTGIYDGYTMVWNDEFDGDKLDTTKWSYQIGTGSQYGLDGWGNSEAQYYTDSENNVKLEDGKLIITAINDGKDGKPYTSGRIRTIDDAGNVNYAVKYGRVEAKMKLPTEEGAWPAFWMLPVDASIYEAWAASGEIDIMEARGRLPKTTCGTAHFGSTWPNNKYDGEDYVFDETTDMSGYHLYAVDWQPGKITWYVDNQEFYSMSTWNSIGSNNAEDFTYGAPFDVPFYILLNLAVGGTFDSEANLANGNFPAEMLVDYVRVYTKDEGYDENISKADSAKDTASYEEYAKNADVTGNYIVDKEFNTLGYVTEVDPLAKTWQFCYGANGTGGSGTPGKEVIDGVPYAFLDLADAGSQGYSIQLINHVPFAQGYSYEISFKGKASSNRSFTLSPSGDGDNGWAKYETFNVDLTTQVQEYTYQFTMNNTSDPTARIEFNFGTNSSDVWIGDVVVKQIDAVNAKDENASKTPLAGGNCIYNGSFDQGTNRLAFWNATNANAEVAGTGGTPNASYANVKYDSNAHIIGTEDYSHKLKLTPQAEGGSISQKGIWMIQSEQYKVSMDVACDTDTDITVSLLSADGKTIYASKAFAYTDKGAMKTLTSKFAMKAGITDKDSIFVISADNGKIVTIDNVSLIKLTENNTNVDYSKVDLNPVPENSTKWSGVDVTTGELSINGTDGMVIEAVNATINYQRMLLHEINLTKGVTYELKFKAKSEHGQEFALAIQEDNSWETTLEAPVGTSTDWQEFDFKFESSLTNAGNPIFLKYLLSGPNVTNGMFYLKDVTLKAVVTQASGDAPEGTAAIEKNNIVAGRDNVNIVLAQGDWTEKFKKASNGAGNAVVMVNNVIVDDYTLNVVNDKTTLTIDKKYFKKTASIYAIELALEGYNNIKLDLQTKKNPSVINSSTTGNSGNQNANKDKKNEKVNKKTNITVIEPVAPTKKKSSKKAAKVETKEEVKEELSVDTVETVVLNEEEEQTTEKVTEKETIEENQTPLAANPTSSPNKLLIGGGITAAVLIVLGAGVAILLLKKKENELSNQD